MEVVRFGFAWLALLLAWPVASAAEPEGGQQGASRSPPPKVQASDQRGALGAFPVAEPKVQGASRHPLPAGDDADLEAFQEALRGTLPLTAAQVRAFRDQALSVRREVHPAPIRLVTRSEGLSFAPGKSPARIRVGPKHVASIAFLDNTGAPWPVASAVIGAPDLFSVMQPGGGAGGEGGASHILTVTALEYSGASSLNVVLQDAPLPLTIELAVQGDGADGSVALRLDRPGPQAVPPLIAPERQAGASDLLMLFLDGTPPPAANRLRFRGNGAGVQAWSLGGRIYLRTGESLTWPAWIASVRGGDGVTTVYELAPSDALVMSERGALARYRLEEGATP